jgi:UDP-N-acetylmuramoylalanine--D-glutamate ligase
MMARVGDVVLLSPACTSYDAYANFERRGEHFCQLVEALGQDRGQPGKEVQASRP